MNKPVLLVGGAPEIQVDAVRFLSVHATGNTAVHVQHVLVNEFGINKVELLLSRQAAAQHAVPCQRYRDRSELETQLKDYLRQNPDAVVLMSAAVNDYEFSATSIRRGQELERHTDPEHKIASGADEFSIHLKPATKLIDQLKDYGHRGALFACKYEGAETVVDSAVELRDRVQAVCVLANSLCGSLQALVDSAGSIQFEDRPAVLAALAERIADSARI